MGQILGNECSTDWRCWGMFCVCRRQRLGLSLFIRQLGQQCRILLLSTRGRKLP